MTRPLQFIPFKSRADKGWAEAWELYEKSFPYNERWNAEGYDRAFGDPNFEADGIWRGEEFIGILESVGDAVERQDDAFERLFFFSVIVKSLYGDG
mgnify:CR=1 FL=1